MVDWGNFQNFFTTGLPSVVLYSSLIVAFFLIALGLFCGKVSNKARYTLVILLVEYLFVVVCSTIICRGHQSFKFAKLELVPFWTYNAVIEKVPGVSVWDIILNMVLFVPLGFLIKLIYPAFSLGKVVIIAVCCSLFIETNQYVFEKGIAQIDDVMHNTIGCAIGWMLSYGILSLSRRKRTR